MKQCCVTSFVDLHFYRFSVGTENLKKILAEYYLRTIFKLIMSLIYYLRTILKLIMSLILYNLIGVLVR